MQWQSIELPTHPLAAAAAACSATWPELRIELGPLEPGWVSARDFFASPAAIDDFLAHEGALYPGADLKGCAAFMMRDYLSILSLVTVPLFLGHRLVPDLAPSRVALRFHDIAQEQDGRTYAVRRAYVRYLSPAYATDRPDAARHADARAVADRPLLCEQFRAELENHVQLLVGTLKARTGLASGALWRLVGDAIAGRFLDVGEKLGRLEEAKAAALSILKQPGSPLANRQLHFFDIALNDDAGCPLGVWTFRARGGCCRYYTVEGGVLCPTCVLKPAAERDADLRAAIRRHLGLDGTAPC